MAIHHLAVVDKRAVVHPTATIGPFCVVEGAVTIEADVELKNHATVYGRATIGAGTILYPHCVVGSDPQDLKFRGEDSEVIIGKRCKVHEYVTVSKGTSYGGMVTSVGDEVLLMAGAHVAHDCRLGNNIVIGNNSQLAGHIVIGDRAIISGMVGVHHFATIGELSFVGAMSGVRNDVPPFCIVEGYPAEARTLNVVGLRRAGYSDDDIRGLKDAFRILIHDKDRPRKDALAEMNKHTVVAGSLAARLRDWVANQLDVSVKGRVQEAFRDKSAKGHAAPEAAVAKAV